MYIIRQAARARCQRTITFARFILALAMSVGSISFGSPASASPQTAMHVDAGVALSSLVALSDGHLRKLADTMQLAARRVEAQRVDWSHARPALAELRPMNVACVLWFALPDGSYWTLEGGRQPANLRARAYFARLLSGNAVIGDLVVSKSTKKAVAIVAVPIVKDNAVAGAFGASVYLDRFSEELRQEMSLAPDTIFYSFDSRAVIGLNWDKRLIFLEPRKMSPDLDRAFGTMLTHTHGVETYVFRGRTRTVLYRKSNVTGWWYALGFA